MGRRRVPPGGARMASDGTTFARSMSRSRVLWRSSPVRVSPRVSPGQPADLTGLTDLGAPGRTPTPE